MSRKTRKLIWSAPLVAVLAVAGALAIFHGAGYPGVCSPTRCHDRARANWKSPSRTPATPMRTTLIDLELGLRPPPAAMLSELPH